MAWSEGVGQQSASGTSSSPSVTLASCTANRTLLFALFWDNGGSISISGGPSCSGESPQVVSTPVALGDSPQNSYCQIGYIAHLAGSGSKTVSFTLSGSANWMMFVDEKQGSSSSGVLGTGLLRTSGNQAASPTTFTLGSLTTSDANSMIWGVTAGVSTTPAITGHSADSIGTLWKKNHAHTLLDAGSAGSKSIEMTIDVFGVWSYYGAEFLLQDPSGTVDLAGGATAGAAGSATITVQRNLAAAAVAGALASGALSVNRALTGAAIGAALGSATLTAFSQVWRIPTSAPNGTAVHATVFSGASPTYAILAQGTTIVAGGYVDIPTSGTPGTKALAFVHNYNDNTATTSIRGGPSIATLTSI